MNTGVFKLKLRHVHIQGTLHVAIVAIAGPTVHPRVAALCT